jgi:purine-binding chemotaxis protein CheW
VPIAFVEETMRPLAIEPLARMPEFVLGISVVRGAPTPIVDAARLLGATASAPPNRWITIRAGARRVALAVSAVEGVRDLAGVGAGKLPPLLSESSAEVVAAVATLDAELLVVLRCAHLLPQSAWSQLEHAS